MEEAEHIQTPLRHCHLSFNKCFPITIFIYTLLYITNQTLN